MRSNIYIGIASTGTICARAERGDFIVLYDRKRVILSDSRDDETYKIGLQVRFEITGSSKKQALFSRRGSYSPIETVSLLLTDIEGRNP